MKKNTFWMASLKDVSQTLRRGDWAAARPHRIRTSTLPLVLVARQEVPFQTTSIWSQLSATDLHTTLTWPLVTLCRANGVRVTVYLDDFLVLGRNKAELTHLGPRQRFEYLDLLWDSEEFSCHRTNWTISSG